MLAKVAGASPGLAARRRLASQDVAQWGAWALAYLAVWWARMVCSALLAGPGRPSR